MTGHLNFTYQTIPHTRLDDLEPVWTKSLEHESSVSTYFSTELKAVTFEQFKAYLTKKTDTLRLDTVRPDGNAELIGCCISTVTQNKFGEIELLYVDELFRRFGVGTELIRRALNWLDEFQLNSKSVMVNFRNSGATQFYRTQGFRQATTTMVWKKPD